MDDSFKRTFQDIGLPDGHAFPKLIFHEPTNSLVVHTVPKDRLKRGGRLSIRRVEVQLYRSIATFAPGISVETYALDPARPFLYFLTYEWKELEAGSGKLGGHWHALHRFALEDNTLTVLAKNGDRMFDAESTNGWVSGIISVGTDGESLICKSALKTRVSEKQIRNENYLSRLCLRSLNIERLTLLERTFA